MTFIHARHPPHLAQCSTQSALDIERHRRCRSFANAVQPQGLRCRIGFGGLPQMKRTSIYACALCLGHAVSGTKADKTCDEHPYRRTLGNDDISHPTPRSTMPQ